MAAGGNIVAIAGGLILASWITSRWLAKQAERPAEIVGDVPFVCEEMLVVPRKTGREGSASGNDQRTKEMALTHFDAGSTR